MIQLPAGGSTHTQIPDEQERWMQRLASLSLSLSIFPLQHFQISPLFRVLSISGEAVRSWAENEDQLHYHCDSHYCHKEGREKKRRVSLPE